MLARLGGLRVVFHRFFLVSAASSPVTGHCRSYQGGGPGYAGQGRAASRGRIGACHNRNVEALRVSIRISLPLTKTRFGSVPTPPSH